VNTQRETRVASQEEITVTPSRNNVPCCQLARSFYNFMLWRKEALSYKHIYFEDCELLAHHNFI
jgi:hypothetical protein